jgi:hypothetical protein
VETIQRNIQILKDLKVKLRVQILWGYPGVDFKGKGLSQETLKALQREAMQSTNSVAWRHRPKPVKPSLPVGN